jgi:hypothetical protein
MSEAAKRIREINTLLQPTWSELNHAAALAMEVLADLDTLRTENAKLREALAPLVRIADAYDDNALDDEARKTWGLNDEHINDTPPEQIELYSGRGGRHLLSLADCLKARTTLGGNQ